MNNKIKQIYAALLIIGVYRLKKNINLETLLRLQQKSLVDLNSLKKKILYYTYFKKNYSI